jgi:hypothetical protein
MPIKVALNARRFGVHQYGCSCPFPPCGLIAPEIYRCREGDAYGGTLAYSLFIDAGGTKAAWRFRAAMPGACPQQGFVAAASPVMGKRLILRVVTLNKIFHSQVTTTMK